MSERRLYYASPSAALVARDADERQSQRLFALSSPPLEKLLGARDVAAHALEIKHVCQFVTLVLPLLADGCTLGQGFVGAHLLQRDAGEHPPLLRPPGAPAKVCLAAVLALLDYTKANARKAVGFLAAEAEGVLGVSPAELWLAVRERYQSPLLSALAATAAAHIGSDPVDAAAGAISLLEDLHRMRFFEDGAFPLIAYRLLGMRHVTPAAPQPSRTWRVVAWVVRLRMSILAATFLFRLAAAYLRPPLEAPAEAEEAADGAEDGAPRRKCPLCMEALRRPSTTPCGHVFCWGCIHGHLGSSSGPARCPICRVAVSAPLIRPLRAYA